MLLSVTSPATTIWIASHESSKESNDLLKGIVDPGLSISCTNHVSIVAMRNAAKQKRLALVTALRMRVKLVAFAGEPIRNRLLRADVIGKNAR